MYRLLCALITVLYCIQPIIAQKIIKNKQGFKHSFQIDVIMHSDPELSFQYEEKLQKNISILGSIGFKKHKLPGYFSLSEYKNSYIFEKTSLLTWILFLPISSNSEKYLGGALPLDDVGNFVPESSIPVSFSIRKYFGDLKKRSFQGFWSFGLIANIHSGYAIKDKTKIADTQKRTETTGGPITGSLATIITTYYDQTRSITAANMTTFGMNATLGLHKWMSEHVSLTFAVETGANFSNTNENWAYYGIKPSYLNIHSAISYSF